MRRSRLTPWTVMLLAVGVVLAATNSPVRPQQQSGTPTTTESPRYEDVFERLLDLLATIPERWTSLGQPLVPVSGRGPGQIFAAASPGEIEEAQEFITVVLLSPPEDQSAIIRTWFEDREPTEVDLWLPAVLAERSRMLNPEHSARIVEAWLRWLEIAGGKDVLLSAASDAFDLVAERVGPDRLLPLARAWAELPSLPASAVGQAHLYKSYAQLLRDAEQYEEALRTYRAARAVFETMGDLLGQGNALRGEAKALTLMGDDEQALETYRRARALYEIVGDPRGLGNAWDGEARVLFLMDQDQQAIQAHRRARGYYAELGDEVGQGDTWYGEGNVLFGLRRGEEALAAYRQARAHFSNAGDELRQGDAWHREAEVLAFLGRFEEAIDAYRQARALFESAGAYDKQVATLVGEGDNLTLLQKRAEVMTAYLEARDLIITHLADDVFDRLHDRLTQVPPRWTTIHPLKPASGERPTEIFRDVSQAEISGALFFFLRAIVTDPEERADDLRTWLGGDADAEVTLWLPAFAVDLERGASPVQAALTVETWLAWAEAAGRRDVLMAAGAEGIEIMLEHLGVDAMQPILELWTALPAPDHAELSRALLQKVHARFLQLSGNHAEALDVYREAGTLFETAGNPKGQAKAFKHEGDLRLVLGQGREALAAYRSAVSLYADSYAFGRAMALHGQGDAHLLLGETEAALDTYRQAGAIFESIDDVANQAETLHNEAYALFLSRQPRAALAAHLAAAALYESIDEPRGQASALRGIGDMHLLLGDNEAALDAYRNARTHFRSASDPRGEGLALRSAGDALSRLGRNQEALEAYREARELFRAARDLRWEGHTWSTEAEVLRHRGENEEALAAHRHARSLYQSAGDGISEAMTLAGEGEIFFRLARNAEAQNAYRTAHSLLAAASDLPGGIPQPQLPDLGIHDSSSSFLGRLGAKLVRARTLKGEADLFHRLGDTRKALDAYQEARSLFAEVGDPIGQADAWDNEGDVLFQLGRLSKALDAYAQAHTLYAGGGSRMGEGNALLGRAKILSRRGRTKEALDLYREAEKIYREIGDHLGLGSSLLGQARLHFFQGENQDALMIFPRGRSLFERVGHRVSQGHSWLGEAEVLFRQGRNQEALEAFRRACSLYEGVDPLAEGNSLEGRARVLVRLGRNEEALTAFGRARSLFASTGDRLGEGNSYHGEAQVLFRLGRNEAAWEAIDKAISCFAGLEDSRQAQANALLVQANLHFRRGEHEEALRATHRARELFQADGDLQGKGNSFLSEGTLQRRLGEYDLALAAYRQAQAVFDHLGSDYHHASSIRAEAEVLAAQGENEVALAAYRDARSLFKRVGDPTGEGNALLSKADLLLDLGRQEEALEGYRSARDLFLSTGAKFGLGATLYGEARIHALRSEWQEAVVDGTAATAYFEAIDHKPFLISARILEAEARGGLGEIAAAVELATHAIELHRRWRTVYITDRHRTRSDQDIAEAYELLIMIRSRQGEFAESLRLAEEARSRVLLDLLHPANAQRSREDDGRFQSETPAALRPLPEKERQGILVELAQVEKTIHQPPDPAVKEEAKLRQRELDRMIEWDNYLLNLDRTMVSQEPLDTAAIQALADRTGPILIYHTTVAEVLGFLVLPEGGGIVLRKLELSASELGEQIKELTVAVGNPSFQARMTKPARELWDQLVEPFVPLLPEGEGLTVIPHGPLHQLPFEALLDRAERPLFERWDVSVAPSASALAICGARHVPAQPADAIVTIAAGRGLTRPAREVDQIASFFEDRRRIKPPHFGQYQEQAGKARHFFIATRGIRKEGSRRGTYLELDADDEHDSRLSADEIATIPLDAELVTLAACDTAAARALFSDERLDLTRAFLIAGAASVLATRWKVPESASTSQFLIDFYRAYRSGGSNGAGLRKDEALTEARRRSRERGDPAQVWAAWVLLGDGR